MFINFEFPYTNTYKPQSNGQQYGDWYTGRRWMSCYIWYSQEEPRRAAAPPRLFIAVGYTVCKSPPISGQCTNFILFHVVL